MPTPERFVPFTGSFFHEQIPRPGVAHYCTRQRKLLRPCLTSSWVLETKLQQVQRRSDLGLTRNFECQKHVEALFRRGDLYGDKRIHITETICFCGGMTQVDMEE
ncbi:hypothetical protein Droror1_Dr00016033 [Drosera rotundifolia]